MSSCKVIVKRVLMLMLGGSAVFNCSSGVADSLYDIDRAVTGAYSVQNSTSTRYIVPIVSKTDAELEAEGYIVIHTAQEFIDAINYDLWGAYALGADINFEGIDCVPLGDDIDYFAGVLNGNGYKIKKLNH